MQPVTGRREQLLRAAADLFSESGYHEVGMDDIGAAAGITGPGVYRHFSSKQSLLESLCDLTMDRMLALAQSTAELEKLVDLHVQLVVQERKPMAVWVREQRALDDDVRRSLRARMREYEALWRAAVAPARPDLSAPELALVVGTALGMLNASSLIESPVPQPARAELLRAMTMDALGC
ncbi:MAG: TetR family transcriptional regulator [Frankiales bacterium]|nr:TetR family transcriptional regulator [Frankiales bacterium]